LKYAKKYMPRPPRSKVKLTKESIEQELQELKNQMEDLIVIAKKDYRKVIDMMESAEDIQMLENSRTNSMRSIRDYYAIRKDLINIQRAAKADEDKVQVTSATAPDADGNVPADGVASVDWQLKMQQIRNEQEAKRKKGVAESE
jgi:hypothetical protein